MKRFVQACFRRAGIDIFSRTYSQNFLYDHHLREMFERHRIQTVLDIGAHDGRYGTFLRKNGFRAEIHSFEPMATTFERLSAKASHDRHWCVYNFALGEHNGSAEINVMAGADISSFLEPTIRSTRMTKVRSETVTIRKLDDFKEPIDWGRTFVKIDTQGYDLAVLCGAKHVIDRVPLLQTEVSVLPMYCGMPTYSQVISWLNERGFDITGMFAVSRDSDPRVREFYCIVVNRSFLRTQERELGGHLPPLLPL